MPARLPHAALPYSFWLFSVKVGWLSSWEIKWSAKLALPVVRSEKIRGIHLGFTASILFFVILSEGKNLWPVSKRFFPSLRMTNKNQWSRGGYPKLAQVANFLSSSPLRVVLASYINSNTYRHRQSKLCTPNFASLLLFVAGRKRRASKGFVQLPLTFLLLMFSVAGIY